MKIKDIYQKYKIMPNLRLHMYRVAGVASVICDFANITVDRQSIVSAALLHDMGNIIKFNLDLFPVFLKPEGKEYWHKVQNEYFEKYGQDEHVATIEIAKEIGVDEKVMDLLNNIGFSKMNFTSESSDFNLKIAAYSDMRVEPHGVVSLEKRLIDGRARNMVRKSAFGNDVIYEKMASYLRKIEKQIFEKTLIKEDSITDEKILNYVTKLSDFEIYVHKS